MNDVPIPHELKDLSVFLFIQYLFSLFLSNSAHKSVEIRVNEPR